MVKIIPEVKNQSLFDFTIKQEIKQAEHLIAPIRRPAMKRQQYSCISMAWVSLKMFQEFPCCANIKVGAQNGEIISVGTAKPLTQRATKAIRDLLIEVKDTVSHFATTYPNSSFLIELSQTCNVAE